MIQLRQSLVANFFAAMAAHDVRRELRAPESEAKFWRGRVASNLAASKLSNLRAVEFILKLRRDHCGNPLFETLCQNASQL